MRWKNEVVNPTRVGLHYNNISLTNHWGGSTDWSSWSQLVCGSRPPHLSLEPGLQGPDQGFHPLHQVGLGGAAVLSKL